MELGKTPHTVYKIRYHLVTAVKYRKALLKPEVEECIRETMMGINERYNIIIDEPRRLCGGEVHFAVHLHRTTMHEAPEQYGRNKNQTRLIPVASMPLLYVLLIFSFCPEFCNVLFRGQLSYFCPVFFSCVFIYFDVS